jgi:hypothetical protein
LWLSHQELAVERNVDVCEELLQGRVGVQEQQPAEVGHVDVSRQLHIKKYMHLPLRILIISHSGCTNAYIYIICGFWVLDASVIENSHLLECEVALLIR